MKVGEERKRFTTWVRVVSWYKPVSIGGWDCFLPRRGSIHALHVIEQFYKEMWRHLTDTSYLDMVIIGEKAVPLREVS